LFLPRSGSIDAHEMMLALKKMGMEPTEDQVIQDPAQRTHPTALLMPQMTVGHAQAMPWQDALACLFERRGDDVEWRCVLVLFIGCADA
jgi:hypothetical protein